jgi:hypothetical protein
MRWGSLTWARMVDVVSDPNVGGQESDEARLVELANELADGVEAALPAWVERSVARILHAWSGDPDPLVTLQSVEAGRQAQVDVGSAVRALLLTDVDEQRANPLAIIRRVVAYPTEVLRRAGVPPVVRDPDAARRFPDDDYDLTPGSFADIDPRLHEVGLAWGAAKAHVFKARRRGQGTL